MADNSAGNGPEDSEQRKAKRAEIAQLKVKVDDWLTTLLVWGTAVTAFYGLGAGLGPTLATTKPLQLFSPFAGMLIALARAGAAMGLGVIAGFLFGLPRALTNPDVRQLGNIGVATEVAVAPQTLSGGEASAASRNQTGVERPKMLVGKFAINTNLERISDWLTTMIVGIGLANLYTLVPAIEEFGNRFVPIFGEGGKVFSIGCGMYFLIFGFLFSYINTRTKLTLIFTENEYDATSLASGSLDAAVGTSSSGSVVTGAPLPTPAAQVAKDAAQAAGPGTPADASNSVPLIVQPTQSDQQVLDTIGTVQRASSREELVALANARARSGNAEGAVNVYKEIVLSNAFDAKIWLDYASALGLANNEAVFLDLLPEIRTKGTTANEAEARNNFAVGLLGTLQAHLYDGQYDLSIAAGKTLERYPLDGSRAPWKHIWLACAWGQKHAALKKQIDGGDHSPSIKGDFKAARDSVVSEVKSAIELDAMSRTLLGSLYNPAANAIDRDLESLQGDVDLEKLLAPDVSKG